RDLGGFTGLNGGFCFLRCREAPLLYVGSDELFIGVVELAALRHLIVLDHFPQEASLRLAGCDHRAARTAGHHSGERAEVQPGHLLFVTVTSDAVLLQNWHDLAFEQRCTLGSSRDYHGDARDDKTNPNSVNAVLS